eukprot:516274-Pyramimonas_sp.AAC.1
MVYPSSGKADGPWPFRCVRECFHEWDNIERRASAHRVCFLLFDRSTSVSMQVGAFGNAAAEGHLKLHDYPEASLEVQDRALARCVGRIIEAEHKQTRGAVTRNFTYAKPAVARARQRKLQTLATLEDPRAMHWLLQHWSDKDHWGK